ncbi:restriction endonuclease subunit M [Planktothrix agardhii]|uniref:restriction endonuclease subunit M n=1 Tax=Planktothrix agardhii TaxID=1160 RepID=UPI0028AFF3A3|nr:N-6 DNA methylase [Planktothrix agardhii]
MTNETISLIPSGKLRCVVSGKLRQDTPEENVRQRIARSLLDNYGYEKADIEIEFTIKQGSKNPRVDIAIFPPNTEHKQENIKIIVECKREEIKPTDRDNGVEQLKSYISACLNTKFGMWIGSELQVWEKITDKNEYKLEPATDIPRFGFEAPQPLSFAELVPAQDELIDVFKRCHNYIYGNQGFQKEQAFQELLKIIFCKVYDEDTATDTMRFFIGNKERRSEIGQRQLRQTIESLYEAVKQRYPYIFDKEESIRLENRVLAYLVGEMQRFSFLQTEADVKGTAYEQLVGSNLRGDRGEFFTPRNVCEMASRMALLTYPQNEWLNLKILDPTCGTGGFLVAAMNVLKEVIREQQLKKWCNNESKAEEETTRILKQTANRNLLGIDFNPILVRAAQMNLVMHGDGSTNVFHANSLLPPGEWPSTPPNDVANYVKPHSFDVIVTNPPFGSNIAIDDSHILDQFEIARLATTGNQASGSLPPEQLFIERCLYLLKPSGRLAIVLPDSILSNPGLATLRRWILKKARIIASVDLPQVTFEPYTGTQTSVLLLQKKTEAEIQLEEQLGQPKDYQVFMTMPQAVGHDRRGNVHYLRTPEGDLIEYEEERLVSRRTAYGSQVVEHRRQRKRVVHDDLPEVVRYFSEWLQKGDRMRWLNG